MKLSIRGKIILVCGLMPSAMALILGLGVWQLSAGNDRLEAVVDVHAPSARIAARTTHTGRLRRELTGVERGAGLDLSSGPDDEHLFQRSKEPS